MMKPFPCGKASTAGGLLGLAFNVPDSIIPKRKGNSGFAVPSGRFRMNDEVRFIRFIAQDGNGGRPVFGKGVFMGFPQCPQEIAIGETVQRTKGGVGSEVPLAFKMFGGLVDCFRRPTWMTGRGGGKFDNRFRPSGKDLQFFNRVAPALREGSIFRK
jgi:hypothetical protein